MATTASPPGAPSASPVTDVQALPGSHAKVARDRGEQPRVRLAPSCLAGQDPGVDQRSDRERRPGLGELDRAVAEHADLEPEITYRAEHRERVWAEHEQLALRGSPGGAGCGQRVIIGLYAMAACEFAERGGQIP